MTVENTREPLELAAGDTIDFTRTLPDWPATDGWFIRYEVRGVSQPIEFDSVASGVDHLVEVAAATTAGWLPGDYALAGYVLNEDESERHQIYYSAFKITPNLPASDGDIAVTTHAQRMITKLETRLEEMADHNLNDSKVETSEFYRVRRKELTDQLNYYKAIRANEIAAENAKNGRPTGNKITPIFRITQCGSPVPIQFR